MSKALSVDLRVRVDEPGAPLPDWFCNACVLAEKVLDTKALRVMRLGSRPRFFAAERLMQLPIGALICSSLNLDRFLVRSFLRSRL